MGYYPSDNTVLIVCVSLTNLIQLVSHTPDCMENHSSGARPVHNLSTATCIAQVDGTERIFQMQPKFVVIIVLGILEYLELGLMYVYYKDDLLHAVVILRLLTTKLRYKNSTGNARS